MGRTLSGARVARNRRLDGIVTRPCVRGGVKELSKLEQKILADYVIPLVKGDLELLQRNGALLFYYKEQLELQGASQYFVDIIDFVAKGIGLLEENKELRSKVYAGDGLGQLYFQTSRVRLLPEYELYNALIGAPKFKEGEKYNMAKIAVIKDLLGSMEAADLDYGVLRRLIASS